MKLLLTGATGFVGRNLLLRAIAENRYDEIWVLVRSREKLVAQFVGDGFEQIPAMVKTVVCSAQDWDLENVPPVDHLVHCAGLISAPTQAAYLTANVEGTLDLFRRLIQIPQKIIVLSSQAASGPCRKGEEYKDEGNGDEPITWYGQSKLSMEQKLREEFSSYPYVCLRPPMILGPRDHASLPLFKMVRRPFFFKAGLRPKFYSYISVFDLASAVFFALEDLRDWRELSQRVFYVSAEKPVSDRELITSIASVGKRKGMIIGIPQPLIRGISRLVNWVPSWRENIPNLSADRVQEMWPERWVVSSRAFQTTFHWKPFENFEQMLKQTNDWYVKTGQLRA